MTCERLTGGRRSRSTKSGPGSRQCRGAAQRWEVACTSCSTLGKLGGGWRGKRGTEQPPIAAEHARREGRTHNCEGTRFGQAVRLKPGAWVLLWKACRKLPAQCFHASCPSLAVWPLDSEACSAKAPSPHPFFWCKAAVRFRSPHTVWHCSLPLLQLQLQCMHTS